MGLLQSRIESASASRSLEPVTPRSLDRLAAVRESLRRRLLALAPLTVTALEAALDRVGRRGLQRIGHPLRGAVARIVEGVARDGEAIAAGRP